MTMNPEPGELETMTETGVGDGLADGTRRGALAVAGAVLVLAAVAYLGTAAWAGTRTPRGTTVAGVDVGGLDRTTVRQRLEREVAPRADRPLTVLVGQTSTPLTPASAGLGIDARATAGRLVGFSLKPAQVWEHVTGSGPTAPVSTVDRELLRAAVERVAARVDQEVAEGAVTFTAKGAVLKQAAEGRALDLDAAADVLIRRWYATSPVRLPATVIPPAVPARALASAYEDFARPATSGPLKVAVGERTVSVPVAQLAPTLSLRPDDTGTLQPAVDGKALERIVRTIDPRVVATPRSATIEVVDGKPVTRASSNGRRIDPAALAEAVLPALTSAARTAVVEPVVVAPRLTTAELKALGIREQVSTFTTAFPFNPPRTTNIRLAAAALDGTIVQPGETFSLNAALGERTPEKGYQEAPVINRGRLTTDYGGGISQVSTTLFNAVFFAGLDTISHKPHSFYISRYPEGREATISWPTVDQTFRNDSGHGILIKTAVTDSQITVSFYGTKVWEIESVKGPRTNVKQPKTIRDDDGDCVTQSPSPGFDVTVTRVFKRDGRQVRTERFATRYIPEDRVICG